MICELGISVLPVVSIIYAVVGLGRRVMVVTGSVVGVIVMGVVSWAGAAKLGVCKGVYFGWGVYLRAGSAVDVVVGEVGVAVGTRVAGISIFG